MYEPRCAFQRERKESPQAVGEPTLKSHARTSHSNDSGAASLSLYYYYSVGMTSFGIESGVLW